MRPLAGRAEIVPQTRGRRLVDQALAALPAALLCMAAAPLLAGCGGRTNIGQSWAHAWGPTYEGREPPPGADAPYPNLGTVPERPARPTPGQRQEVTSGLEAARAAAARPIMGGGPARIPPIAAPIQDRSIPTTPPRPAAIEAAPPIDLTPPAGPVPAPAPPVASPAPGTPAPVAGPAPSPAAPAPVAAQPPRSVSPAPPPPPPPALMAPGAGPPAAPSSDLLAPSPRNR